MTEVDRLRREVLRRLTVMETHDKWYTLTDAQREQREKQKYRKGDTPPRRPTEWVPLAILLEVFEDAVRAEAREP